MTWKLKKDDDGKVVFQDEKPVYVDPDGKELALDPPQMYGKIIDLGKESKGHRERAEGALAKVTLFDGIEDLAAYKTEADAALETVKNFNEKDWLKADKVEKLKKDMKEAYEEQEATLKQGFEIAKVEAQGVLKKKDGQIRMLMVSNKFATSPYFSGPDPKTTLPPEIAETYFGKNFKVEEDVKDGDKLRLVAYNDNGDQILSRSNPGELAAFDEAMGYIFEAYPGKERLMRTKGAGSGGAGGTGDHDEGDSDDIKKLETQYADAVKAQDAKKMVVIKNQLFAARQKARMAA